MKYKLVIIVLALSSALFGFFLSVTLTNQELNPFTSYSNPAGSFISWVKINNNSEWHCVAVTHSRYEMSLLIDGDTIFSSSDK